MPQKTKKPPPLSAEVEAESEVCQEGEAEEPKGERAMAVEPRHRFLDLDGHFHWVWDAVALDYF